MRFLLIAAAALALQSCVPYPGAISENYLPASRIVSGPFQPLDAGASELESLHFKIRAYGSETAKRAAEMVEADYNRIMVDTDLFSFRPQGLYQIVIYGTSDEYHKKTSQPPWSAGVAVGNAIYSYENPGLNGTLAHEITHLIFYEYMGRVNVDHRWVNEGLAVYEQGLAMDMRRVDIFSASLGNVRQQPMPMDQMIHLVPATERENAVSVWYAQAESMVRYMIERGGRIGFSQFLRALAQGKSFDDAYAVAFPGKWSSLKNFEEDWLRQIGQ